MLNFRSVNRRGAAGYLSGWQRHHLIPSELAASTETAHLLGSLTPYGFSLDDFARNGVLLPASEAAARASGLPFHAGPHPRYTRRVAKIVVSIGCETREPLRRLARVLLLQTDLRRQLAETTPQAVSIDVIDLSIDSDAHRRLDADVEALLARFAQRRDIA
jgi:hypothetical protein